ncbi:MAG: SDR family NAD(P)-dependent oxidoreductase [bacterium]|nr:SDR family NAD(P)-dependent oxidoreductase [bacterium]
MFSKKIALQNLNILITGSAQGIGKHIALYCAMEGANCILHDRPENKEVLSGYAAELSGTYLVQTSVILKDLTDSDAPQYIYDAVLREVPHLDILINNAGIISYGNFHEMPLETLDNLVTINARTYMALMRLFIPGMIEKKFGRILNISSVSAFQPSVYESVYGATKAFIQSLSEAVRQELRGSGVTVCTVCPPFTQTGLINNPDFPDKLWWYSFSRVASPESIAKHSVRCLKKGKSIHVPGFLNYFTHLFLMRFFPRNFVSYLCSKTMKPR